MGITVRYRNDQVGSPCSRRTGSPSAGPASTYAIRNPSVTVTKRGWWGNPARPAKRVSGVRNTCIGTA
jgi:hypothetical protein